MCVLVYIASDSPLPTIPWDAGSLQHLYVAELTDADNPVPQHFTKPYVYYIGAHDGCGCGFSYGQNPQLSTAEDEADNRESVRMLREYLENVVTQGPVELYAAWADEEGFLEETRANVTPSHFAGESFAIKQREFLLVEREP
jgi:hypothetical protein